MADETTQTGEETSWWDLDIFADSEFPSTSFDEPLEWPETLDWGDFSAGDGDLQFPGPDLESGPIFPPTSDPGPPAPETPAPPADAQWRATGDHGDDPTMPHITVLSGLGGTASGAAVAKAAEQTAHERLPDSLWAGGAVAGAGTGVRPVATPTTPAPPRYAEPDGGGWKRRFDIRHGNAAIIALISFVSLILLGMFMSVRARNQVPDTSQTRTTSEQIQVQAPLNTVPLTVPASTIPPAINIADLVPPPEDATTGTAGGASPATTAVRSTPAGGATATTQPAAQPTNTTAAPQTTAPPQTTTPPATSPPPDDTTVTTRPRIPTSSTPTTPTTEYTVPTFPPDFGVTIPTNPRRFG
ncbi:MAG TPA: hypothetical protein VFK43_04810 [Acidimicrobiales bacterium]|nr:hypothetical protein [Acidimicrobiales bacterium]